MGISLLGFCLGQIITDWIVYQVVLISGIGGAHLVVAVVVQVVLVGGGILFIVLLELLGRGDLAFRFDISGLA